MRSDRSDRSLFDNPKIFIGVVKTGGHKVYVCGYKILKTRLSKDRHWVEAGRRARPDHPVIGSFRLQDNLGYSTRTLAVEMVVKLFRDEARFREFISVELGSESIFHSTAPTLEAEPLALWESAS